MRRRCSTWSARATSIRASPTRPARCSRSGSARWKAASARSRWRAGRPRCTWRSSRSLGAGSHIVASRSLYGGSHNLLDFTLPRFGIETSFVDPRDLDAWRAAIRPETRLLFGETLGNPGPRGARHPAHRGARARARPAAARRFDVHDAVSDAAVRARRGPGLSLGDQISFRPRRGHRRPAGRRRHASTGTSRQSRQVPDADRALRAASTT